MSKLRLLLPSPLVVAATVLVAASGCAGGQTQPVRAPAATAQAPRVPRNAEECARCDGEWSVRGTASAATCNCRTRDAWHPCKDGFDCEGACVVSEAPDVEVVQAGKPARGYFLGHCSDHVTPQGCKMLIEKGARQAGPVSLDVPPQRLCLE